MKSESHYKAYILRIWQVERDEQPVLVASLEDCYTNQRIAFASLPAMLAFLERATQQVDVADEFLTQSERISFEGHESDPASFS